MKLLLICLLTLAGIQTHAVPVIGGQPPRVVVITYHPAVGDVETVGELLKIDQKTIGLYNYDRVARKDVLVLDLTGVPAFTVVGEYDRGALDRNVEGENKRFKIAISCKTTSGERISEVTTALLYAEKLFSIPSRMPRTGVPIPLVERDEVKKCTVGVNPEDEPITFPGATGSN